MKTFILTIIGLLALANAYPAGYPKHYAQPAEYVQLFSWSLTPSILNCFCIISVEKRNRKDPFRLGFGPF